MLPLLILHRWVSGKRTVLLIGLSCQTVRSRTGLPASSCALPAQPAADHWLPRIPLRLEPAVRSEPTPSRRPRHFDLEGTNEKGREWRKPDASKTTFRNMRTASTEALSRGGTERAIWWANVAGRVAFSAFLNVSVRFPKGALGRNACSRSSFFARQWEKHPHARGRRSTSALKTRIWQKGAERPTCWHRELRHRAPGWSLPSSPPTAPLPVSSCAESTRGSAGASIAAANLSCPSTVAPAPR